MEKMVNSGKWSWYCTYQIIISCGAIYRMLVVLLQQGHVMWTQKSAVDIVLTDKGWCLGSEILKIGCNTSIPVDTIFISGVSLGALYECVWKQAVCPNQPRSLIDLRTFPSLTSVVHAMKALSVAGVLYWYKASILSGDAATSDKSWDELLYYQSISCLGS